MTAVCVTTFEPLWLFITGVSACRALGASKELTSSFYSYLVNKTELVEE